MSRAAVGIDLGGTKVAGLLVEADGGILSSHNEPTPVGDVESSLETIHGVVEKMRSDETVAIGVGVAGLVDSVSGILRWAPNLDWEEVPIRGQLEAVSGLPCVVDNDANAAAWAEHRFGAGRGYRDMLMITVGTGIGGGLITGDRLWRGAHGLAGEIGHIVVEPGGPQCGCGNLGCWEQVASGSAIARMGAFAATRDPSSTMARLAGEEPVTGEIVARAAESGDAEAGSIIDRVGFRLGQGLAGLVNVLDPEIVVIGGGVVELGERLLEPAREAFLRNVEAPRHRPEVPLLPAALGNDAGAIGAATMALEAAVS